MTGSVPGFGGQGYVNQESRALSSIEETPGADLSQGQDAQIKMLQSHDYQIKFLAQQMKQAQKGVNTANQNPIQQVEQFISDIIILLGGGQLAAGALDFGDLQYILPALGALFGFGDGPFPISLFQAAEKFFLGYVVPNAQFVDVINGIIQAWLGTLGIDPKFIKDVKSLVTALGDLFDGLSNLLPSLNELFAALGISGTDLGPFGQALAPIMKLFTGLDLKSFGNMIEFITSAIDPFIVALTAIINWVDSILAVFGFTGTGGVVNSPLGATTLPFGNLLSFLGGINFGSSTFDPLAAAATFITNILNPAGLWDTVAALIKLFVDILTFNWAAIAADLASLTSLGVDGTQVSTALSQSVTSTPRVTHDASSVGEAHTGNPTTKTVAHTTSAAANPAMVAHVAIGPLTPKAYTKGFVTVTYNGVELKSEGGIDSGHGTDGWLEQFTLLGPASGTHDLVVTTADPVHSIVVTVDTYVACSGFSGFMSAATNAVKQDAVVRGGTNGRVVVAAVSAAPIAAMTGATQRSLQNVDTATTAGNLIVGDAPGADSVTVTTTR